MKKNKRDIKIILSLLMSFLIVFSFCSTYVLAFANKSNYALNNLNFNLIYPKELIIPIILAFTTSLIVFGAYYFIFKGDKFKVLLSSLILIAVFSGYQVRFEAFKPLIGGVNSLLPIPYVSNLLQSLFFCLLLFFTTALIVFYFEKYLQKFKPSYKKQIIYFAAILVLTIFTINVFKVSTYLYSVRKQISYRQNLISNKGTKISNRPDIYYIVLDRYTNNTVLKNYFDFDNSAFLNTLRAQGFNINDNSYSSYPYTALSIGSTMSASYLTDIQNKYKSEAHQSETALYNLTRYSSVANAIKSSGYKYTVLGSWYGVSNKAPLADKFYNENNILRINSKTAKFLSPFEANQFQASPFYDLLRTLNLYTDMNKVDYIKYQLKTINNLAEKNNGGNFVFGHLLIPHDPYVFNEDGSISTIDTGPNDNGKTQKNKYLDQIKFINTEIEKITKNIISKSNGNAVIIIQSDEGPYPQSVVDELDNEEALKVISGGNMENWSKKDLLTKYGVLAAYYLPSTPSQELEQGANSVNIFRLVLNNYLGYKLDYLPICNFGLTKGRSKTYNLSDITSLINNGKEDIRCKDIHKS